MKKAIYFVDDFNPTSPPANAICITYDTVDGFEFVENRKTISVISNTDKKQNDEIESLKIELRDLKLQVGGGQFETDTTIVANNITDGKLVSDNLGVELISFAPEAASVQSYTVSGTTVSLNAINIPANTTTSGILFNINSNSDVTISNSTINTTSNMTSVLTINAGTGETISRSGSNGTVKLSGINIDGGIKTSNTNVWNLDKSTAIEITDCNFNLSGYNGIMIGQNHDGILPKTIDIENCTFNTNNGKLNMFAISIFATQDDAVINIKNCTFKDVTECIRFGNSTAASGVIVNIENCHFANIELEVVDGGFMSFENFQSASEYTKPERLTDETDEEYASRCCLEMLKYDDEVNRFGGGKMTINFINCTYGKEEIKPFNFPETEYINILGSATDKQFIYMVNWCYSKKHGNTNVTNIVYPSYEAITTDSEGNITYPEYVNEAWGEMGKPVNVGPDCWPTINIAYNE